MLKRIAADATEVRNAGRDFIPVSRALGTLDLNTAETESRLTVIENSLSISGETGSIAPPTPTIFVPASYTAPTAAASWTVVNGLAISDNNNSIRMEKGIAGLGLGLKPVVGSLWDYTICIRPIAFGNMVAATTAIPNVGLYVTNGTSASLSSARGIVLSCAFGSSSQGFVVTRSYATINASTAGALNAFFLHSSTTSITDVWLRVQGTASTVTFYVGDGYEWYAVVTASYSATHVGFGLDPTNAAVAASTQICRLVSSNI